MSRLLHLFFQRGGKPVDRIAKRLSKPKLDFGQTGLLGNLDEETWKSRIQMMQVEGYTVFENILNEELCEQFMQLALNIPGKYRQMDDGKGRSLETKFSRENPLSIRFDYDSQNLINEDLVQRILADTSILKFAQDYLKAAPILDLVTMWWHTSFSKSPDKEAAQWFHFDMERTKWVKFFFYITDVDENSGPHVFIPKSHSVDGIPNDLRSRGYVRLSDEDVIPFYPEEKWKQFTGKRGTLIVEDTRGLHKGKHVVKGDRLLFQLEFTSSEFGQASNLGRISKKSISPTLKDSMSRFPSVYSLIKHDL
jgi:ectoine hydroxylase-related dioxygenase (phytanoyl-CoA dioxygenase family)